MEVHAHSHPASGGTRKKWTHYLWEFLMLFLAVFCGFLAENFREHLIENAREKVFVKSLMEDLQKDSARLNYSIRRLKGDISNADSLVRLYVKGNKNKKYETDMAKFGLRAGQSVDVVFNDRTSSQLKGTGSMRLIRNKEVADSLLQYWNNQIRIALIHDRYETFRFEQRKIGWKTFNWYPLNYENDDRKDTSIFNLHPVDFKGISTGISNDQMVNEFVNITSNLYSTAHYQYLEELEKELLLAKDLILLIKNKYHLE